MLTQKVFIRKTKRGNILKIVREHYLREDIGCGSVACDRCLSEDEKPLQKDFQSASEVVEHPHYVVPDTNVVLHQIDVLKDESFRNVIVPQTVIQELRHRHAPAYNSIREVLAIKERHFYCFVNEHHKDTYVERLPGESANDRNDRAIRKVVHYLQSHLEEQGLPIKVVLVTNDRECLALAKKEGLTAFSLKEYVGGMGKPELLDKISLAGDGLNEGDPVGNKKFMYPEHLTPTALQGGIKSGRLRSGKFMASRENYLEGFVCLGDDDDEADRVLIQGLMNLNRAVQDDTVVVEILPESEWVCPSSVVLEDEPEEDDKVDEEDDDGDEVNKETQLEKVLRESKTEKGVQKMPTGKIVGILKRQWRPYCGILALSAIKEATKHLFVAAERKIPKVRIETRQAAALAGKRIVVAIDSWPRHSRYPLGHYVRTLGEIGDRKTENQVLLLEHDIPHQPFSQAVLKCLPKMPWLITAEDEAKRQDFRAVPICSVDPPGCTDIDDALHARHLPNGNFEVGVHIADVSHFIRPHTAIDKEAASRGTTVYLVDQRIDMIPDLLSSNLCSLKSDVDRFAFSAVFEMTEDAKVVGAKYCKSIIRSKNSFTYAEAQARIDDKARDDEVTKGLRVLNSLAKKMKVQRMENGALNLASSEVRFQVDSETHDPIDVKTKELLETNSMVEEFMLLANKSVAEFIYKEFSHCALLRRHPIPPVGNFDPLVRAAATRGFDIKVDCGKNLADSLDEASIDDDPFFNTMLRMVATRCMSQAIYFCTGTIAKEDFLHYGLALSFYTHFTSPIRRYSDLVVHRLLAVAIGADSTYPELLDKLRVQNLCNNLNYRHRMAQYAGRASVALFTQIYFRDKKVSEEGYILFVRENALQVLLPKYGMECTLYVKDKPGGQQRIKVPFAYDEEKCTQTAEGVTLRQFERVTVQVSLDRSNVQHQKIIVQLLKPHIPGFSPEVEESMEVDEEKTIKGPDAKKTRAV